MKFQKTPWKNDPRSKKFSHHQFFGTVIPSSLPKTLGRARRFVENQLDTLRCGPTASAANAGYARGVRMSPDRQAVVISRIQGFDVDKMGSDPNAVMKAGRDYGYVPYDDAPLHLIPDGKERTANPINWGKLVDKQETRDSGYVRVDGPYDLFDDIRSAIALAYDAQTGLGAGVQAFVRWFNEWTESAIIPTTYNFFAGYHSYLFIDWIEINGVPYLVAQNSYGRDSGDGGFHLFPREVVNREFSQRNTSLKIPKPLTAEQVALAKQETITGWLQRLINSFWYELSIRYGSIFS